VVEVSYNQSLNAAIGDVISTIDAVTGVKAFDNPADAPSGQWPLGIGFPRAGRFTGGGSQQTTGYHTIVIQLHYPRSSLSKAYSTIIPYVEGIIEALHADPTLGGTVTTISGDIGYSFGSMTWAEIPTIGWQFEVPVKIRYTDAS